MSALKKFTVNTTTKTTMPNIHYINELARAKNFQFKGDVIDVPPIMEDLYYLYNQERELAEEFDVKDFLFSKQKVAEILGRELTDGEENYYNYSVKFLAGLNYKDCPGFSPMDKTLNTILYMTYLSDKLKDKDNSSCPSGKTNVSEEDLTDMIQEFANGASTEDSDGKKNKEGNETKQDIVSCVRDFLYDLSPEIANIYGKDSVASIPINKNILRDLKVKAHLEDKVGLETSLDKKFEENNASRRKEIKPMTEFSQVTKANKVQMLMPNYKEKLAKKELQIKVKVKPVTKKQSLYMLLDDSGSMNCISKQSNVRAVLMNRLESVIQGKSELKFSLYESSRYHYKEVKTLEEAQALYKDISLRRPGGGGTYIGRILQETINDVVKDTSLHSPEIMIVNDGDDFVDPKDIDFKGVKINVVILGTDNANLKKIAEDSGGFYQKEHLYDRR